MANLGTLLAGGAMPMATTQAPAASTGPVAPAAAPPVTTPSSAVPAAKPNPVVGAWKQFITNVQTDPNFRKALFQTGVGLMQSPQLGQNNWDVAANALNRGMMTLEQLRELDRQRERDTKEDARKDTAVELDKKRTGAYVTTAEAQAGESSERRKRAEYENSPEFRELERKAKQGDIDAQEALKKYHESGTRLRDRTDPNITSSSGGGFDVQSLDALTDMYVQEGMAPVDARARAAREIQENRRRTASTAQLSNAINARADMLAGGSIMFAPPEQRATILEQARQQVMAEQQQSQARANVPPGDQMRRANILGDRLKNKQVKLVDGTQVLVIGPHPKRAGMLQVRGPDNTTYAVDPSNIAEGN